MLLQRSVMTGLCCLWVVSTVVAFCPSPPLAQRCSTTATTSAAFTPRYLQSLSNNNNNDNNDIVVDDESPLTTKKTTTTTTTKAVALIQTIWNRMDTLEASGINAEHEDHPPLVQRGGGFKRFMVIMSVGMLYKWYRARFINKIPFWEKQPQWNMVVTTKEQEDALRAYTCLNCGSSIFIARNREWYFEGGTGIGGLGCYACGTKGKDNFVMNRDELKEEGGDEDDYYDFERPLDFVTAAERRQLLKETAGDEEAANALLVGQAEAAGVGDKEETPMFGMTVEEAAEAKKKAAAAAAEQEDDDDDDNDDANDVAASTDDANDDDPPSADDDDDLDDF